MTPSPRAPTTLTNGRAIRIDLSPSRSTSVSPLSALSLTGDRPSRRGFGARSDLPPELLGAETPGAGGRAREGATPLPGGEGRLTRGLARAPFGGRSLPRPPVSVAICTRAGSRWLSDRVRDTPCDKSPDMLIDVLSGMRPFMPLALLLATVVVMPIVLGMAPVVVIIVDVPAGPSTPPMDRGPAGVPLCR